MKDYIKMMLEAEKLKFLVFAHHLTMLQACTEAVIEAKVTPGTPPSGSLKMAHKMWPDRCLQLKTRHFAFKLQFIKSLLIYAAQEQMDLSHIDGAVAVPVKKTQSLSAHPSAHGKSAPKS